MVMAAFIVADRPRVHRTYRSPAGAISSTRSRAGTGISLRLDISNWAQSLQGGRLLSCHQSSGRTDG
jgi:hypothetical protein